MTNARWAEAAKGELIAAAEWYESKQLGLGEEFIAEVGTIARKIAETPSHFPAWGKRPKIRRAVVGQRSPT